MIYNNFKDLKISALGFGTMRLPTIDGKYDQIDQEKVNEMFDHAIKNGVNYFDTAWGYHNGMSEIAVGKAADFTLANLDESFVVDSAKFESKGKNTPFNGYELSGVVKYTLVDGAVKYRAK